MYKALSFALLTEGLRAMKMFIIIIIIITISIIITVEQILRSQTANCLPVASFHRVWYEL